MPYRTLNPRLSAMARSIGFFARFSCRFSVEALLRIHRDDVFRKTELNRLVLQLQKLPNLLRDRHTALRVAFHVSAQRFGRARESILYIRFIRRKFVEFPLPAPVDIDLREILDDRRKQDLVRQRPDVV